jgi:hypothetical protein
MVGQPARVAADRSGLHVPLYCWEPSQHRGDDEHQSYEEEHRRWTSLP